MKVLIAIFCIFSVYGSETTKKLVFEANGLIEIKTGAGEINVVRGNDKEVTLKYVLSSKDEDCVVEEKKNTPKHLIYEGKECYIDFDLKVPVTANLKLKSGSGEIAVREVLGSVDVKTGSGNIRIEGNVKMTSAQTGSGNIRLRGDSDELNLSTGSGNIKIDGYAPEMQLKTGSGDLRVAVSKMLKKEFNLNVRTGSGSIRLLLPEATKTGDVNFKSGYGKVRNNLGTDPNSEVSIDVRTGFGDLHINKI